MGEREKESHIALTFNPGNIQGQFYPLRRTRRERHSVYFKDDLASKC